MAEIVSNMEMIEKTFRKLVLRSKKDPNVARVLEKFRGIYEGFCVERMEVEGDKVVVTYKWRSEIQELLDND